MSPDAPQEGGTVPALLDARCPKPSCKAAPGEPCKTASGKVLPAVHEVRVAPSYFVAYVRRTGRAPYRGNTWLCRVCGKEGDGRTLSLPCGHPRKTSLTTAEFPSMFSLEPDKWAALLAK